LVLLDMLGIWLLSRGPGALRSMTDIASPIIIP
jgi:hypothetical protein